MFSKKVLSAFMTIILAVELFGCGNNTLSETENSQSITAQEYDSILVPFRKELYVFPAGCTVKGVTRSGSKLMVYGADNGTPILGLIEYSVDESGILNFSETELLKLDCPEDEREARIYDITTGEDGNFYVLTGELPSSYTINGIGYSNDDYKGNFAIIEYTCNGEFINSYKIDNWHSTDIIGMLATNTGMLIYGSSYVSFVDWVESNISTEIFEENNLITAASLTSEGPVISSYDFSMAEAHYYSCDVHTASIAELNLKYQDEASAIKEGNWSICQGLNGEYILNSSTTFVNCEFNSGDYIQLFQWDPGRTPVDGCYHVSRISEYGFACALKGTDYLLVTGMVLEEPVEQTIVKIAICGDNAGCAVPIVQELNSANTPYRYDYTFYDSSTINKALVDILSADPPDLLIYYDDIDTSGEAFENLYEFMDSDTEINKDSFLPNYLETLTINGELHELWTGIVINTVAARAADINGNTELTPEFYTKLLMENERYNAIFESYMTKENLLKWVAEIGVSLYIDKENGTCSFNSESFSDLLMWCNEMGNDVPEGSTEFEPLDISEVILSTEIISTPERVAFIRELFGESFSFVGFPVGKSMGNYYSCPIGCFRMAIPKNSGNKSGAWEFIKQQVNFQTQIQSYFNLPVNYEAFLRIADAKLNDEDLQQITELAKETLYAENVADSKVREIIMECGNAFIAGDKSIEETVSAIQSRTELYLAERN